MTVTAGQQRRGAGCDVLAEQLALAALGYARRGWAVFPCRPGRKTPATGPGGFHHATTDIDQVTRWWWHQPLANIGIATGAPGPDVLDVDVKAAGTGWAAFNRAKRAGLVAGGLMLVETRNGGLHVYYQGSGQLSGGIRGQFLDFKASGGYVLAPPSVVAPDEGVDGPGAYRLLDQRTADGRCDWSAIRALLETPRPPRPPGGHVVADDITGLVRHVAGLQPGNRNNGTYWAACKALAHTDDLTGIVAAAHSIGLPAAEIATIIASARRTVAKGI
jgi:hypothetical protein